MIPAVEEVLNELDGHRVQFAVLSRWLTPEQLERRVPQSTWIVKDFLSHLATIDGPVSELFRSTHEGRDPGIRTADGARLDVDAWNERQVLQRRSLTVDEILEEAARERTLLRAHLARLTEADLAGTMKFQGDGKRPPAEISLGTYLKGWCKHDVMHAADMLRAMPERMTPILERWLDDPVVRRYQAMMNSGER